MKKAYRFFTKYVIPSILLCSLLAPQTIVFAQEAPISPDSASITTSGSTNGSADQSASSSTSTPAQTAPADATQSADSISQPEKMVDSVIEQEVDTDAVQKSAGGSQAPITPNLQGDTTVAQKIRPETDPSTGALVYGYDIELPKGVHGLTPSLALKYNSQNQNNDSIVGYGWSVSIPYIKRQNLRGTDKLYVSNDFVSSQFGELVSTGKNTYAPRAGDTPITITNGNNGFSYTTKDGLTYTFGDSTASRQDDSNNTANIYAWMLSSIKDTYGNTVTYTYIKDQGQIYPESISYEADYSIKFITNTRTDVANSYATAFNVQTRYIINEIEVLYGSNFIKKYELGYTKGDNNAKLLLQKITETYFSGGITKTLPETSFSYTSNTAPDFYDVSGVQSLPSSITNNIDLRKGVLAGDINGDAYPDIVKAYQLSTLSPHTELKGMLYNPKTNVFDVSSTYTPPNTVLVYDEGTWSSFDGGTRFVDVNGDNKLDFVRTEFPHVAVPPNTDTIEISTSNGWQHKSTGYPAYVNNPWYTILSTDVNGDGFLDYIQDSSYTYAINCNGCIPGNPSYTGELWTTRTSLNDGFGFNNKVASVTHNGFGPSAFSYTPDFTGNDKYFVFDINTDGLPDLIYANQNIPCGVSGTVQYQYKVYINTGTEWKVDPSYVFPAGFYYTVHSCADFSSNIVSSDFNRDGLLDFFVLNTGIIYINQGNSFKTVTVNNNFLNQYIYMANQSSIQNKYLILDINGDGALDFMFPQSAGNIGAADVLYKNIISKPIDLLETITTPSGLKYEAAYQSSAQYKDTAGNLLNPKLPIVIQTVHTITDTDPATGAVNTHTYTYKDGSYYYDASRPTDRKFAGFGAVTDTSNTKIVTTYYHTGSGTASAAGAYQDKRDKIGRAYRQDIADLSGNILKTVYTKWDSSDTRFGGAHVRPIAVLTRLYDKSVTDTAVGYTYDKETGDVETVTEYGLVKGDDEGNFSNEVSDDNSRITTYTYATNNTGTIRMTATVVLSDQKGILATKNTYLYDNLPQGMLSYGSATSTMQNIDQKSVSTQSYKYDPTVGYMTSSTDPLGNTTTYTYDSYGLYPVIIADPLGYTTNATFDYTIGKPLTTTDQNNITTIYTYDSLGRTTSVSIPDPNTGTQTIQSLYVYDDTPGARLVSKTDYRDSKAGITQTQYLDGFDRSIQNNTQTDTGFVASWVTYTPDGLVFQKTLPVAIGSDTPQKLSANPGLITTSVYDALGRVVSISDTTGTTKTLYEGLTTKTWDHANVEKDYRTDAFGNLVGGIEYNAGKQYITNYDYDIVGNLVRLTDALGNTRSFEYDMRGKRLSAEDIHPQGLSTGMYTYNYDQAGNILSMRTPAGVVVAYAYNKNNQKISEDNTSTPQKDIVYTYNSCPNGIGRLCQVIRDTVQKEYEYTSTGQVATEKATIAKNTFTTQYNYDLQNNPIKITYPDSMVVDYTYGTQGITRVVVGGAPYISKITYTETGAPLHIDRASGVATDYTYDPTALYRLTNVSSTGPAGAVQDDTYAYDTRGLITARASKVPGYEESVTYEYDDLMRLIQAKSDDAQGNTRYDHSYTYSPVGSLLADTGTVYTYKTHPHAPVSIGGVSLQYDKNGNRTVFGKTKYTYTYRNELALYNDPSYDALYTYDDAGSRVRVEDSTDTYFPNKYTTFDYNTNNYTNYIYAGGTLLGQTETVNPILTNTFTNTLGSTVSTTDDKGTLLSYTLYEPYGLEQNSTQSLHKGYIGQYTDPTDLSYLNARYYESKTGVFLSEDPVFWELGISQEGKQALLNPQSQNSYSYANGNPIVYSDPNGKFIPLIIAAAPTIITAIEVAATAITTLIAVHDIGTVTGTAISGAPASYKNDVYSNIADNWGAGVSVASQLSPGFIGEVRSGASTEQKVFSAGGYEVKLNPSVTEPYARPVRATIKSQQNFVNTPGSVCVTCGKEGKMVADHKVPLLSEYYQTGSINPESMRSTKAVQPQCTTCSAQQGGYLSSISKQIKVYLNSKK